MQTIFFLKIIFFSENILLFLKNLKFLNYYKIKIILLLTKKMDVTIN